MSIHARDSQRSPAPTCRLHARVLDSSAYEMPLVCSQAPQLDMTQTEKFSISTPYPHVQDVSKTCLISLQNIPGIY